MTRSIHDHHLGWNPGQPAVTTVAPGDRLTLSLQDASGNRVRRDSDAGIIPDLKPENANPLTGPVHIDGAEAGDLLVVDILDFAPSGWGWTALIPGFGLLAEDFPAPWMHISDYDDKGVRFAGDILLPTRPFAGTIGVCPAHAAGAIPPHTCGGNMDFQDLRAGSRLYFPVKQPGALFSAGDGHAAQGDGEVCGTAVETRLDIEVKFGLLKQHQAPSPRAVVSHTAAPEGRALVTTGIGPDLMQAGRDAVRYMIDELSLEYGLSPELAYCLCSCAADLRLAQIVNAPNCTVACVLPLTIFK